MLDLIRSINNFIYRSIYDLTHDNKILLSELKNIVDKHINTTQRNYSIKIDKDINYYFISFIDNTIDHIQFEKDLQYIFNKYYNREIKLNYNLSINYNNSNGIEINKDWKDLIDYRYYCINIYYSF